MDDWLARTRILLGDTGLERLAAAHVAVFGLGGVGSFCAEALIRAGVGALTLVDDDRIDITNLNRQLIALHSTLGRRKATVMAERALDINPACCVTPVHLFYSSQTADQLPLGGLSYIVDAVDTVSAKLLLAQNGRAAGVPVISAMGTGNKLDAASFRVADLYSTDICPLARIMRKELRRRGVDALKVVYSPEPPRTKGGETAEQTASPSRPGRAADRPIPGSISFVPAAAGLMLAGAVIRDLAGISYESPIR